jgi:tRNA(adenine34) deaminase
MKDEEFMKIAIEEAEKALKRGDFPVGCVVVKNGKMLSKASGTKITTKDPLGHAELIAIQKACKKLNSGFLDDCTIYASIEPCLMCANAMVRTRVKRVVYGVETEEYEDTSFNILKQHNIGKNIEVISGVEKKKAEEQLKRFKKGVLT